MDAWIMSPRSPTLDAALSILADGKPRSATEIFAEGVRRGLFDPRRQKRRYIYSDLWEYIDRALGVGNKPLIIQDSDRRFRLSRPIDDWPAIDTTGLPPLTPASALSAAAADTIAALRSATNGSDYEAFERAVCAAFELFGFAATHVGGNGAPDGYADALLGELQYRVMIECKLSSGGREAQAGDPAEAAKYRDAYHGHCCTLVAPSFSDQTTFVSELHTHDVAAWTTDDLARAATMRLDCSQMRELFAPGFAADGLDDMAWAQIHGPAKRQRVVASLLVEIGLEQHRMAHTLSDSTSVPRLSPDVALSLIDDRLTAAGTTHGVTREEIDAAFTWLTSPYVGRAIWTDGDCSAIVIRPTSA
jgi:hypothetical protein